MTRQIDCRKSVFFINFSEELLWCKLDDLGKLIDRVMPAKVAQYRSI